MGTAKENSSNLEIAVISCADLPDKDWVGIGLGNKSDPYVKVKVNGYENQTKVAAVSIQAMNSSPAPSSSRWTEVILLELRSTSRFGTKTLLQRTIYSASSPGHHSRPSHWVGAHSPTPLQVIGRRQLCDDDIRR